MKPGYRSSELYITIASMVIGFLVTKGVVVAGQAAALVDSIATIVGAVMVILPAVVYIVNRTWLKSKTSPVAPSITVSTPTITQVAP